MYALPVISTVADIVATGVMAQVSGVRAGAVQAIGTELAEQSVQGGWHWAVLMVGPIVLLLIGIGVYTLRRMTKGE